MAKRVQIINKVVDTGDKQCRGKKKYTKKEAQNAARAAAHSGRVNAMRVYPCPNGHWHIAHINDVRDTWE